MWIGDLLGVKVLINAFLVSIKEKWHIEKKTSIQYKSNNGINVIFSMFVSFIYYSACIIFWKKQWKFWPNLIYLSTQWFAHSTGMQVTTQTKAINWTNQPLCQYLQSTYLTHENGIFIINVSPEKWSFLNVFHSRTRIKADQLPILFGDSSTVSKYRNEKNKTRGKKSTSDML